MPRGLTRSVVGGRAAALGPFRPRRRGQVQTIEAVLDAADNGEWQPELVAIYGRLSGSEQTARIAKCEAWLRRHPDDARLLKALGRMCVRQRLWGKAQSYLEASLAVEPTPEAHLELARLCDQLQRTAEANKHYRAVPCWIRTP